jgi:hypothetical protein
MPAETWKYNEKQYTQSPGNRGFFSYFINREPRNGKAWRGLAQELLYI